MTAAVRLLVVSTMLAAGAPGIAAADDDVPKQVDLIEDGPRLVASNITTSRFDELKLEAGEDVVDKAVGDGVIVVVTNKRVLGYGVRSGWREMDLNPHEDVLQISAQDYAGLVVTVDRFMNFNGETGVWAERKRKPPR